LYPTGQPAFTERNSFENSDTKKSEMINVHILCSKCPPPPAATHARSLFRRCPAALLIMRWSSLSHSHSSAVWCHSSSTSLMLVL